MPRRTQRVPLSEMTEKPRGAPPEEYVLKTCAPADLTDAEIEECVSLVSDGGAVPRRFAEPGLRNARVLAVVRQGAVIVAVGAIKRVRNDYAARRAKLSGFSFPSSMREL